MEKTDETPKGQNGGGMSAAQGWDPLIGQRIFKSTHEAWRIYGQYRFSVSARTFQTFIGEGKAVRPRPDTKLHVEDIELFAQSKAWPPAPFFVRGAYKGGKGGAPEAPDYDTGAELNKEKLRGLRLENEAKERENKQKMRELLPRREYEQKLAAAAAVVGVEAETFVYDKVREIIHVCGGNPEKEDSLREYLLNEIRAWLHAFSRAADYDVTLTEDGADERDATDALV